MTRRVWSVERRATAKGVSLPAFRSPLNEEMLWIG